MKKEVTNKACAINPTPNLVISCQDREGRKNALVVAFAGNASLEPPMVMAGVMPERFSHHMIKETGVFVINIPARGFEREYNYLGSKSGKDGDKFEVLQLKWEKGTAVDAPLLTDCPVNIECKVAASVQPGTHDLFIATVEAVHCEEKYLDENGNIKWGDIPLL